MSKRHWNTSKNTGRRGEGSRRWEVHSSQKASVRKQGAVSINQSPQRAHFLDSPFAMNYMKHYIKSAVRIIFVILIIAVVIGCGKKQTSIEGKVVDGMGQPMSGIKVTAKQFWPVKGYEQFETTTDSDGIFRFKGLFPSSDYSIFPWSDEWKTSEKVMVKTGLEGKTSKLSLPITVRFILSNDGIITDSQLRLQWAPAPDQPMDWFQAKKYAQDLSLGGGGWRLPTRSELKSVYNISMKGGADLFFRINENWVWTSETQDDSAWFCSFIYGREGTTFRKYLGSHGRVLAVRSLK